MGCYEPDDEIAGCNKWSLRGLLDTARFPEAGFMNYDEFFADAIGRLRHERRYRVFADLERIADRFPRAIWHSSQGPREVVIRCSNDYLGLGPTSESGWRNFRAGRRLRDGAECSPFDLHGLTFS
jgi:hypothetical protein